MAELSLQSTRKLVSGYEIPVVGFGVCFQESESSSWNADELVPICLGLPNVRKSRGISLV